MERARFALVLALLTACSCAKAAGEPGIKPQDYWMGIYCGKEKLGYVHTTAKEDKRDGKRVFRKDIYAKLLTVESGERNQMDSHLCLIVQTDFSPISETFRMEAARDSVCQEPQQVELVHGKDSILLKHLEGGKLVDKRSDTITTEDRELNRAGVRYEFGAIKLSVGSKLRLRHWYLVVNPDLTVDFLRQPTTLEAVRHELLELDREVYGTTVVEERTDKGVSVYWLTENGELAKKQMPRKDVTLVRETKEEANKIGIGGGPDIGKLRKSVP